MRKIDENKDTVIGMAAKTINFEKLVLLNIEKRARAAGTNASKYINRLARQVVLSDANYWSEQKKYFWMKFQEAKYNEEQARIKMEIEL